jgi:hypothetical protein
MRLLVGIGLFTEIATKTYVAAPKAALFVSKSPMSAALIHLCAKILVLYDLFTLTLLQLLSS